MKKQLKKNKWYLVGGFLLVVFYFVLRLTNLTDLPIFTDEAIYIRWAQIGSRDPEWRFISLVDGKQPMSVWGMMVTVRLFDDPLFAGRFVSVITGFFGMIGAGVLGWELFNRKRIGFLTSLLYLTSPFALMYDRMALMDSTVAMFSVWSLAIAVMLVRRIRLDIALILGMALGGAMLTKTSGFLSMYMLPMTIILFDFSKKAWKIRLVRLIGLIAAAAVLSQIYYSVLRLSPLFHMVEQKDGTFVQKYELWDDYADVSFPHRYFIWLWYLSRFFVGNIRALFEWTVTYLTPPVIALVLGAFALYKQQIREKLLMLGWYLAPIVALAYFGLLLYPRFIFFMTMPLLPLAAWSIDAFLSRVKDLKLQIVIVALILSYPLYVQSKILFSIVTAPIPKNDSDQYINDWPAGWGVREAVDFFTNEAKDKKIVVYTDGTFGLMPYALEIYLVDNPNIKINGIWPAPPAFTPEMETDIATKPTYYVSNREQMLPAAWRAEELFRYRKGKKNIYLRIFRLLEKVE